MKGANPPIMSEMLSADLFVKYKSWNAQWMCFMVALSMRKKIQLQRKIKLQRSVYLHPRVLFNIILVAFFLVVVVGQSSAEDWSFVQDRWFVMEQTEGQIVQLTLLPCLKRTKGKFCKLKMAKYWNNYFAIYSHRRAVISKPDPWLESRHRRLLLNVNCKEIGVVNARSKTFCFCLDRVQIFKIRC